MNNIVVFGASGQLGNCLKTYAEKNSIIVDLFSIGDRSQYS